MRALIAAAVPALLLTAAGAETLTVEQAAAIALAENYGIRIAGNEVTKAEESRLLKIGAVLPTLRVDGSALHSSTEGAVPGAGDAASYSVGATLNWTLFDGFRMFYAAAQIEQRAQLAETASRHTIESTVLGALTAYYGLAGVSSLLGAAREQLEISRAQLARIQAQHDYGRVGRRALLAQQVTVNSDSAAVAARELDEIRARHALNIALGRRPDQPVTVIGGTTVEEPEGDPDSWYRKALAHNAGLKMEEIRANIAASQLGISRAAYWPVLAAGGSVTRNWGDNDYTRAAVGLTATWPLFTGFRTLTAARTAEIDKLNAELSYKNRELELEALVYEQWEVLLSAYRRVGFERDAVASAEESLVVGEEQYRLGALSDTQFRETQLALLNARVRLESVLFQSIVAAYQLRQIAGELRLGVAQ